jgi:hypothetical protein
MAAMPLRIFVGLAEEYRRAGRFSDAMATLRNGLEAHPTYLSARIAIARLYQETGRVQEAIDAFSKVLVSDRENLVAAKALGDLYGRQGNAVEAIKKLKLYRALAGDRSVDERIAALEREANPEPAAPHDVPGPPSFPPAAAAAPAASSSAASRLFDPMNYATRPSLRARAECGSGARRSISDRGGPSDRNDVPSAFRQYRSICRRPKLDPANRFPAAVDAAPPGEEPVRMTEAFPAAEELESAESPPTPPRGGGFGARSSKPPPGPSRTRPGTGGGASCRIGSASPSATPSCPPRTLAELYERQGFRRRRQTTTAWRSIAGSAADWVPAAGRTPSSPRAGGGSGDGGFRSPRAKATHHQSVARRIRFECRRRALTAMERETQD